MRFGCGGSLIKRRYILTAAHCVDKQGTATKIRLGELDLRKDWHCLSGKCAPLSQTIDIEEIRVHESYDHHTGANDIALIRMVAPAKLNPGVGVVCLPGVDGSYRFDDNQFGLVTAVVGWGAETRFSFSRMSKSWEWPLQSFARSKFPLWTEHSVLKTYPSNGIDVPLICAGKFKANSCRGDSGVSLQTHWTLDLDWGCFIWRDHMWKRICRVEGSGWNNLKLR